MRPVSIGVVIPVHGFAPFLPEALDGVLAQESAPDRVVVVEGNRSLTISARNTSGLGAVQGVTGWHKIMPIANAWPTA